MPSYRAPMASGALRDVALAIGIVAGVLGVLFLYTGVWPPMVVVESGSMMHAVCRSPGVPEYCDPQVGYGKFGTIDPGDMVFVQHISSPDQVRTMAQAEQATPNERNYGKPGDVVVYFTNGNTKATPIIHRAIAYIEATDVSPQCANTQDPGSSATYKVFWEGQSHTFRASEGGIYLPSMGFGEPTYRQDRGYKPCWSGFITKGDNPVTNTRPDQATGIGGALPRQPVRLDWIQGKAIGELPWFGLIKLAVSTNPNAQGRPSHNYDCSGGGQSGDPACEGVVLVLNANAPGDLWVMLGVSLAVIAIAPLAYDLYLIRRDRAKEAEAPPGPGPETAPATPPPRPTILRRNPPGGGDGESGGNEGTVNPEDAFAPPRAQPPREKE